ncbi:MAG: hypothetical protein DMF89_05180 [Acidobacteria bacterium]|nr:MAG: hypothetical protein DMF89_05180 [Acidobacteriota bacterium]
MRLNLKRVTLPVLAMTVVLLTADATWAAVSELVPWSLDAGGLSGGGLTASVTLSEERVQLSGTRRSITPWGFGGVDYVAGATVYTYSRSPGTLDVDLIATGPNGTYGSGSGFKAYVQFWNDSRDFAAVGLIYDPAASPLCAPGAGVTLMVEGNSSLVSPGPIGGYWNNVCIWGAGHHFKFQWTANTLSITLDNPANSPNPQPLVYPIVMNAPSISFMGGARLGGDSISALFQNIVFSASAVPNPPFPITIPQGQPYVRFRAPVQVSGNGTGYNAYMHMSDAPGQPPYATVPTNNAMSVGIQADQGGVNSLGVPTFTIQRVINGQFDYRFVKAADNNVHVIELDWWASPVNVAVFYADGVPISSFGIPLNPRLIFAVDGGVRLNNEGVQAYFQSGPGQSGVTVDFPGCSVAGTCGLNGFWNTSTAVCPPPYNCFGLTAKQTGGGTLQNAMFTVTGTATGVGGGNWDTLPIYAAAVIAQQWFGQ